MAVPARKLESEAAVAAPLRRGRLTVALRPTSRPASAPPANDVPASGAAPGSAAA